MRRATERLAISLELWHTSVKVKYSYYEGDNLAATWSHTVPIGTHRTEWKRRVLDIVTPEVQQDLLRAVKLWRDQLALF